MAADDQSWLVFADESFPERASDDAPAAPRQGCARGRPVHQPDLAPWPDGFTKAPVEPQVRSRTEIQFRQSHPGIPHRPGTPTRTRSRHP